MGTIHKLAAGPITLSVASVYPVAGNFGPQFCFCGEDGLDVYISELSTVKQLERIGLTTETAVGKTLYFEQVKKDGKTFTNIALAGSGMTPFAAAPAPVQQQKAPVDLPAIALLYSECVAIAMATLGNKCEEAGVPIDASAIQAAAATLFIRASR